MRTILACLALAACVTIPAPSPAERVAGCWLSPTPSAVAMRWAPDPVQPEFMIGVRTGARGGTPSRFRLAPGAQGAEFCELSASGEPAQCWAVAEGESGSLEGGRAFIDRHGERLTIEILGATPNRLIFQGHRRGCGED
jgi:hypothetical protein